MEKRFLSPPYYSVYTKRGLNSPTDVPRRRLDELQLWNCFSYYPSVHTWDILEAQAGKYIGKDKKWHPGKYLFTVDFAHPESNILDTDHSEYYTNTMCAHIIALDDGNYAAQPNNRCIWDIPSFTVKDNIPDWKVQTSEWNVENTSQWKTEDTDNFFYEIEEKNMIFEEYKIDEETINDIYKTIKPLKLKDISSTTSSEKGYQTENIVRHFSEDLLKKWLPIKNLWKDIWHIHYIKYSSGGYQAPHNHPNGNILLFFI